MQYKHFEELKVSGKLPSPPGVGMDVLRLTQSNDYSAQDLVVILQKDPALTGRILQLANSAGFASSRPVKTVHDATVRLGTRTIRNIALGVSFVSSTREKACKAFDYDLFWSESLARAVVARTLSEKLGVGVPAEAFVCALLSQLGRLALATVHPDSYAELLTDEYQGGDREDLNDLEQRRFGINNEEVGAAMFRQWKLPEAFGEAIQNVWQRPDKNHVMDLSLLMRAVVRIAAAFVAEQPAAIQADVVGEVLGRFDKWKSDEMPAYWESAAAEWRRWGELMGVRTVPVPAFDPHAVAEEPEPVEEPVESVAGTASKHDSAQILVIEPQVELRKEMAKRLGSIGHVVRTVANSDDAMKSILQDMPQVVICAQNQGGVDGLRLCRSLRQTEFAQGLYFILVADSDDAVTTIDAFEGGVDDLVTKPVQMDLLLSRLRAGERFAHLQRIVEEDSRTMRAQAAELAVLSRKLQKASVTDALTELPNRRYAMDVLHKKWGEANKNGDQMIVLMLDIDHFKLFNDKYGHDVGDEVLRATAKAIKESLWGKDVVCRIGGEEFVVFLFETSLADGLLVAERLRAAVEANRIQSGDNLCKATVSIGVAARQTWMANPEQQLKKADEALYEAKQTGRNRVASARAGSKVSAQG